MSRSRLANVSEEAPLEERAAPFIERPNEKIMNKIEREMRQRMYLMGKRIIGNEKMKTGCEFYVMGEIGRSYTMKLRMFPCCQCGDFLLQRICKHMMFVYVRVLKLDKNDTRIWQKALLPSELSALLLNPAITPVKPKSKFKKLKESFSKGAGPNDLLEQPPLYCPVCCEKINFFEEAVDPNAEPILNFKLGGKPKVKPIPKAKLDQGKTPETGEGKEKKDEKQSEGTSESTGVTTDVASDSGTRTLPAGVVQAKEEKVVNNGKSWCARELQRLEKYEPLLFCPKKGCEVEGCVKCVHEFCWLKWGRFGRVDYTLPNIVLVNKTLPLAFTCR